MLDLFNIKPTNCPFKLEILVKNDIEQFKKDIQEDYYAKRI